MRKYRILSGKFNWHGHRFPIIESTFYLFKVTACRILCDVMCVLKGSTVAVVIVAAGGSSSSVCPVANR